MAISFPTTGLTPNVTTYTYSGRTWLWTGTVWQSVGTAQGLTGTQGITGPQGTQGILGNKGITSGASSPTDTTTLWLDTTASAVAPTSYTLLASGNLTASATNTITIANGSYRTLEVYFSNWGQPLQNAWIRFNGDSGSNYGWNGVGLNTKIDTAQADDGSGNNQLEIIVRNAQSTTLIKGVDVSAYGTGAANYLGTPQLFSWNNSSSAITSVSLTFSGGGSASASGKYTIYGIL